MPIFNDLMIFQRILIIKYINLEKQQKMENMRSKKRETEALYYLIDPNKSRHMSQTSQIINQARLEAGNHQNILFKSSDLIKDIQGSTSSLLNSGHSRNQVSNKSGESLLEAKVMDRIMLKPLVKPSISSNSSNSQNNSRVLLKSLEGNNKNQKQQHHLAQSDRNQDSRLDKPSSLISPPKLLLERYTFKANARQSLKQNLLEGQNSSKNLLKPSKDHKQKQLCLPNIFQRDSNRDSYSTKLCRVITPQKMLQKIFQQPQTNHQIVQDLFQFKSESASKVSLKAIQLSKQILNSVNICKQVVKMLEGVAYTSDEAAGLATALVNGIVAIENLKTYNEKQIVSTLFNEQNIKQIHDGTLSYPGMLDKLGKKIPKTQSIKSRIYHMMANLKKDKKVNQQWTNKFQIKCLKSNEYKRLSDQELQEVIKYETIGEQIMIMAEKINFRFKSMKQESQKIIKLFYQCFVKHLTYLKKLKYDLSEQEVLKIADISRQACQYYEYGVFILLVYLVEGCRNLERIRKPSKEIENSLQNAITIISQKYPPGQGLTQEQQHIKVALIQISKPESYNKTIFPNKVITLKSGNRQKEVEGIITNFAGIAAANKDLLEEIVKATCLQRCIYFKIGLKLNVNSPTEKALTRIKQKMFFKKQQKCQKDLSGSIKTILSREEDTYWQSIDEILKQTDSVQFKISDMLRGKCVFLDVSDIIYTVNSIKDFVKKDPRFSISQIESRFTNKIPISDVTLKIIVNNQILAELQLTVQTNAAAYNFAHKIYELQRTKVFSKLKIVHNYFEQSNQQFGQLASKALQLIDKGTFSNKQSEAIKKYFSLGSIRSKPFNQILQTAVQQKSNHINSLSTITNHQIQGLMLPLFGIKIQLWGKELGLLIDNTLKDNQASAKLKSVLLSFFFNAFNIAKESPRMQQYVLMKQDQNKKIYMQEYLKEYFSIQNAFQCIQQNNRVFQRGLQLRQIQFTKDYDSYYNPPIQIKRSRLIYDIIMGQHSVEKVQLLKQFLIFYFLTRRQDDSFNQQFSCYYNWLKKQAINCQKYQNVDTSLVIADAAIIKAQQLLQKNKITEAEPILREALQLFKKREEYVKALDCQVLLAQCNILSTIDKTIEDNILYYEKNVTQKAKTLGLHLRGGLYTDSIWRISQYLWKSTQKQQQRKRLLETFLTSAITELSRSRGKQFISAMCTFWEQFGKNKIIQPQIKQNLQITNIKVKDKGQKGCKNIIKARWDRLSSLDLNYNSIRAAGCLFLAKGAWRYLTTLNLRSNQIRAAGCQYLVKGDWKNLTNLDLDGNQIGAEGCRHLIKAEWKNLTVLKLSDNQIGDAGCEYLIQGDWENLMALFLRNNWIGNEGCEYLSESRWRKLNKLDLYKNKMLKEDRDALRSKFKSSLLEIRWEW